MTIKKQIQCFACLKTAYLTSFILLFFIFFSSLSGFSKTAPPKTFWLKQDLVIGKESGDRNLVLAGVENIALDSEENIYVLDRKNFRIQKFSPEGRFLSSVIIGRGQGPDEVSDILSMAVTENGGIYVLDREGRKILIIDEKGNFKKSFNLEFNATNIVSCSNQELIILGFYKDLILHIFGLDGVYQNSFGEPFEVPASYAKYRNFPQLKLPKRADFSRDGTILLVNPYKYEIVVYKKGKLDGIMSYKSDFFRPLEIKERGEGMISLVFPWVSALKYQNRLYVTIDDLNSDTPNQLDIFENGKFVSSVKLKGFAYAVDEKGRIFCAEGEDVPQVVRYFVQEGK